MAPKAPKPTRSGPFLRRRVAVLAVAALVLAACQTPAPYAPRDAHATTGYADQQLAANRYRVTFTGNSATKRDTVENYLLLRSAEITATAGFPYFVFDTRDTEAKTTYQSSIDNWPSWRGRGWYRHNWGWEGEVSSRPITSYEASAEIVLLTAEQAKSEPRALQAEDVRAHIAPLARAPQP